MPDKKSCLQVNLRVIFVVLVLASFWIDRRTASASANLDESPSALSIGPTGKQASVETLSPVYADWYVLFGLAALAGLLLVSTRSQKKLQESRARLQAVVDTLEDGVVVIDESGCIESINPAALRLFGYQPDELIGKNVSSLIPEPDRSKHEKQNSHDTIGGTTLVIGVGREVHARRKDGSTFPVELSVVEMRLGGERHFTGIIRDISKRKVRIENLNKANAELRLTALVAQETENAVIITDRDGHILWVNNGFSKITEYAFKEVIGRRPNEFLQGPDTDRALVKRMGKALRSGKGVKEEIVNYTKSGRPYWVSLQIAPVIDEEGKITRFVALEDDITERRRTVFELQTAKNAAEEANRAKSSFLATMSHEIRTPMNGVVGMIDVLRRTPLDDNQRDLMENVQESAFALLTIIDDILDVSKIEAGRLELERAPVSLGRLVETVSETVLPMARRKGIELLIYNDPLTPTLYADAVRLRQILFNLLGNAVKFTGNDQHRSGRIVVTSECRSLSQDRVELNLQVRDNGIGMNAETQERLFQPFVQGESSTTRRFGGTGLGLTICRRLTDMMGGTVIVESRVGEGSNFFVRLTCDVATEEKPQRAFNLSGVSILLVTLNKDEVPRSILERYLTAAGVSVALASSEDHIARLVNDFTRRNQGLVVVMDKHGNPGSAEAMRERIRQDAAVLNPRFVMITRGRRRGFRQETVDTLTLDLDAMRFENLLRAVAVAAGRASPEHDVPSVKLGAELLPIDAESKGTRGLILVAEDNETNQKVFSHQIRMLGHTCEIVGNGRVAVESWRQGRYALILTDCHMPEMDGYELVRMIRQEEGENQHIPIVGVTADALKGTKERCLAAGMDDYLPKPIQLNELQQKIDKWLPQEPAPKPPVQTVSVAPIDSDNEVVDPTALKEVLGIEDQSLLLDFYTDFLRTGEESVKAVRAAYSSRQSDEVGALAHRLKSSARAVGAHALADCCLALEQAGKSGDWPIIDKQIGALPSHFGDVQKWIGDFSAHLSER